MRHLRLRLLATVSASLYLAYGIWEVGRYAGWLSDPERFVIMTLGTLMGLSLAVGVGIFFASAPEWDVQLLRHLAVFGAFFCTLHLMSPFIVWSQWSAMSTERLQHLLVRAALLGPTFTLLFAGTAFVAVVLRRQWPRLSAVG